MLSIGQILPLCLPLPLPLPAGLTLHWPPAHRSQRRPSGRTCTGRGQHWAESWCSALSQALQWVRKDRYEVEPAAGTWNEAYDGRERAEQARISGHAQRQQQELHPRDLADHWCAFSLAQHAVSAKYWPHPSPGCTQCACSLGMDTSQNTQCCSRHCLGTARVRFPLCWCFDCTAKPPHLGSQQLCTAGILPPLWDIGAGWPPEPPRARNLLPAALLEVRWGLSIC